MTDEPGELPDELPGRHDILDLDDAGGYIAINRTKDAPPLTDEQAKAFRALAALALKQTSA